MQRTKVAAAILALLWVADVAAQSNEVAVPQDANKVEDGEYRPLEAEYALSSQYYVDPLPNARIDRVRLYIKGEDAKRIYRSMAVPEQRVDCEGRPQENYTRKVAGGFECGGNEQKGYTCSVAIMFDTGATEQAYVCD